MLWASLVAQTVKNLPVMQETWVLPLGWEDPPEKGMATHCSIFAWRIPWTEKPGGLQFMGLQWVGHEWTHMDGCCSLSLFSPQINFKIILLNFRKKIIGIIVKIIFYLFINLGEAWFHQNPSVLRELNFLKIVALEIRRIPFIGKELLFCRVG